MGVFLTTTASDIQAHFTASPDLFPTGGVRECASVLLRKRRRRSLSIENQGTSVSKTSSECALRKLIERRDIVISLKSGGSFRGRVEAADVTRYNIYITMLQ